MSRPSVVSPRDQPTTFVELFFDLVFVFAVTQLVALLHGGHGWEPILQALLVFWLVWWAWTQFTWALNPANTEHPGVVLATLATTGVAFLMAIGVPDAFGERALWFAAPYAVVRVLGLVLFAEVARANHPDHHASVRLFGGVSAGGLFVIIALGETLIVAAAGLSGAAWSWALAAVVVGAVGTSCALWWSYFSVARPALERALRAASPSEEGPVARDVFSLWHFPMLCGLVAYALAVEEAVAHPTAPLPLEARVALAITVLLFVGGTGMAVRRATGGTPGDRLAASALTAAAVVALAGVPAVASLAAAFTGVAAVGLLERPTAKSRA